MQCNVKFISHYHRLEGKAMHATSYQHSLESCQRYAHIAQGHSQARERWE